MTELNKSTINKNKYVRVDIYDWLLRNLGTDDKQIDLSDLYFFENLVSNIFYDNSWDDDFEIPVRDTLKWLIKMNNFAPYKVMNVNVISLKPSLIVEFIFSMDITVLNPMFSDKKIIDKSGISPIELLISTALIYATQENLKRYYEILPAGIRYLPNGHIFSFVIVGPDPTGKPFSQVMLDFARLINLLSEVYEGILEYIEDRLTEDHNFSQFEVSPVNSEEIWACLSCVSNEIPLMSSGLCRFCEPYDRDELRKQAITMSLEFLKDTGLVLSDRNYDSIDEMLEDILSQIEVQLNITRAWIDRIKQHIRR